MINRLKRLIGIEPAEPAVQTGPLGLVVGGSWRVELFNIRANPEAYHVEVGDAGSVIIAYGQAELGDGVKLHRFYDQDGQMLQLLCASNDLTDVREITLYQHFDSIHPNTSEAWQAWIGPQGWMRQATYELDDGTLYQRAWFADDTGPVEPVQFSEILSRARTGTPAENVKQQSMLYSREIAENQPEHLLVIHETNDAGSSMELMVGVDIQQPQLSIF
jgi:hypothetical protein